MINHTRMLCTFLLCFWQIIWFVMQISYVYFYCWTKTAENGLCFVAHDFRDNDDDDDNDDYNTAASARPKKQFWWRNWSDETKLSELPLLCSHRSQTYRVLNAQYIHLKKQRLSLLEQLNMGVRVLHIETDKQKLTCTINGVNLHVTLCRTLSSINDWLLHFPSEAVLILLENDAATAAKTENLIDYAATRIGQLRGKIWFVVEPRKLFRFISKQDYLEKQQDATASMFNVLRLIDTDEENEGEEFWKVLAKREINVKNCLFIENWIE